MLDRVAARSRPIDVVAAAPGLAVVLSVAICAVAAGARSFVAIAEWVADRPAEAAAAPVPTGGGEERYEEVGPVDRVRTIPQWHALLIHRATPATVVRVSPVWERSDLRPPPAITNLAVAIDRRECAPGKHRVTETERETDRPRYFPDRFPPLRATSPATAHAQLG